MAGSPHGEVEFRYTSCQDEDVVTTLADVRAEEVVKGSPVRAFGSYAGMGHYPGWWWSSTMQAHVGYESLMERDRLMLADFDRHVTAVASQPFGLRGPDGGCIRRHVPDYLLIGPDNVTVVDVKLAEHLDELEVAEVFEWTGHLMARGWRYEVWSGTSPVMLTNVRFVSQGRRRSLVDPEALRVLTEVGESGLSLGAALSAAHRCAPDDLRAALLVLLWEQVWQVDLGEPLGGMTLIQGVR